MEVITREEAEKRGLKTYYTGKPCKHGHLSERRVSNVSCIECSRGQDRNRYHDNKEDRLEYFRDRYIECRDRKLTTSRKWREANPDYQRNYYASNRDRLLEQKREYARANSDKVNAINARYRASKLQRTPEWADLDLINVFYALAKEMTEETGIPHHVDHIIPLQGENVSGLHVATNLQVIPAADNFSKGNSY